MKNIENNVCHDCGKNIEINGDQIQNGVSLVYDNVTQGVPQKINIFKCTECYAKNPALTNFQECEVYSRVVGYIRPVQQWHKGKKQEYGERQEFNMPSKDSCC
ncbi:MAG: anaerobic ribonucleoside-triphosphate reductase [Candidatus Staskawiczbacteria bacterium]|jgi:ribonucleoside-triphosphate reductase